MNDILTQLKQKQSEQRAAHFAEYRELLFRAVDGNQQDGDADRLAVLADALTIPIERVEADLDTVRTMRTLESRTAKADDIRQRADEAAQALQSALDARDAAAAKHKGLIDKANERNDIAKGDRLNMELDVNKLADIRANHWQLLGLESPDSKSIKRHLYSRLDHAEQPAGGYSFVELESLFAQPHAVERFEWIPHEGQTQDKLNALLQIAASVFDHARQHRERHAALGYAAYLVSNDDYGASGIKFARTCPHFASADGIDPATFLFLKWPGYDADQHAELIDELQALRKKRAKVEQHA